jgi:hypothetical protein
MKKYLFLVAMLTFCINAFNQQTKSFPALTKEDYLKKSKKQKTADWILLGGGTVFTITGFAIGINSYASSFFGIDITTGRVDKNITTGSIFFFTGAAAVLGSIPLFIAAHKNKKKAMNFSFKNEMAPQLSNGSFINRPVPSLSLKISL